MTHLLSIILFLPLVGAVVLLLVPKEKPNAIRWIANLFALAGFLMSVDFLLFFRFWEVMLVPMYFLIGIWGGGRRLYSAIKFFLYTLVGSVVMLLGILAIYFYAREASGVYSFDITGWHALAMPADRQKWIFLALFLGFAIKVPMFPFHTWLPDAHTD